MASKHIEKLVRTNTLLLVAFAGILLVFSCKKAIQRQEENIILNAMTSGQWYVEQYKADSTDITGNFLDYSFQFYKNGNVDGIKNTVTSAGTWSSDISSYTITATFPAASSDTLKLLNHTWKITDSYLDYVEAKTTTTTGGNNILHLRKK